MADECGFVYQVCSADYYFQQPNGQYVFKPHELQEAHGYSQQKARTAILQKTPLVIVDNTHICVSFHFNRIDLFFNHEGLFLRIGKCNRTYNMRAAANTILSCLSPTRDGNLM